MNTKRATTQIIEHKKTITTYGVGPGLGHAFLLKNLNMTTKDEFTN